MTTSKTTNIKSIQAMMLDELNDHKAKQLAILLDQAGGTAHLATMLNVHYMTIRGWIDRAQISKEGAKLVEDHMTLGEYFKAKQLRPDM